MNTDLIQCLEEYCALNRRGEEGMEGSLSEMRSETLESRHSDSEQEGLPGG